MIKNNRELNMIFDVIINKNIFDYSYDCIYSSLINSFANEIRKEDVKNGETIMIITEDISSKCKEIQNIANNNKYVSIERCICSSFNSMIELKTYDTDRFIRIIFFNINNVKQGIRGQRCECLVIDIDNNENDLGDLTEESIYKILLPMNIYAKDYKPSHGTMLFYKN